MAISRVRGSPVSGVPGAGAPTAAPKPAATTAPDAFGGTTSVHAERPREYPVKRLPLEGPLANKDAGLSGMAWHGDDLVLLPDRPQVWNEARPEVFTISREALQKRIDGDSTPLRPRHVPIEPVNFRDAFPGFDGCEAIAFHGDQAYVLIEAKPNDPEPKTQAERDAKALERKRHEDPIRDLTVGYLVPGALKDGKLQLDVDRKVFLGQHTKLRNLSFEGLCVMQDKLVVLGELNGGPLNPHSSALLFDFDLKPLGEAPMEALQYRLTDSTPADADGRFWVANYRMDKREYPVGRDEEVRRYGKGETASHLRRVERLVELQEKDGKLELVRRPPVQLQLDPTQSSRNWEALARFGDKGFLIATDTFPESILGYVATDD